MSNIAPSRREKSIEDSLREFALADEDVVRNTLNSSHDLKGFSAQVKDELTEAHKDAVQECIANAEQLTSLHTQILACDQVFERLEKMLLGFQNDLGSISDDMKRLQETSVSIHQELENRQLVRNELSQFVDDIVVPPIMVKVIMEVEASDQAFLEQLHELQRKLQFIRTQEFKEAKPVNDVIGVLENLKLKAIEKIREWVLTKIYMFRKPMSNYQVPQHQLLKYRFFYEFLLANAREVAKEVQEEYIDTISKMFFSYFKAYVSRLFKLLMTDSATKDDLLGIEDTVKATGISGMFFNTKPQVRNRATVFSLGSRQILLTHDFMSPLIVPHTAKEAGMKFQFESLFRSVHMAFVDHCSHEFLFLTDFFMLPQATAIDIHQKVMGRAIALLVRSLDERIAFNFDAISLYLCVCLCEKFQQLLVEREIPPMGGYWEAVSNLLWIRLDQVMSMHNESVKTLDVKKMQPPVDTRPHYIVRRYAELTCALLVITETSGREIGKKFLDILETNEDAVEQLINKMAQTMTQRKERLIFLINNYHMILNIIDERVVQDNRIHSIIHELEQKSIGEFVEVTLSPHFSQLTNFVQECESLVQQGHTHLLVRYNDKLTCVVNTFTAGWKKSIDAINGEIVKSFTDFKNGTNILQATFTQLVQYVQRFSKIVAHEVFRENQTKNEMVNIHHIMVELKKYKPVY